MRRDLGRDLAQFDQDRARPVRLPAIDIRLAPIVCIAMGAQRRGNRALPLAAFLKISRSIDRRSATKAGQAIGIDRRVRRLLVKQPSAAQP